MTQPINYGDEQFTPETEICASGPIANRDADYRRIISKVGQPAPHLDIASLTESRYAKPTTVSLKGKRFNMKGSFGLY